MTERDVVISGSFNSRDLGGYKTQASHLAWRRIFRSGNMANIDQSGVATLKALGITRVIDLRSPKERDAEPDPFGENDGIELIAISLFDNLDPRQLPQGDVLLHLYLQALQTQGAVFVDVLRKIAYSDEAVLFHCTAGKDRTGLIAAMALAIAGVSEEDIITDYAMTNGRIEPLLKNLEKAAQTLDLNKADFMPMLECKPQTMRQTLDWLKANFQGAENYLKINGFTENDLMKLRSRWNPA
ncbi:tyrosine-protein phosphatase [Brucellaceae bacterium C25G]